MARQTSSRDPGPSNWRATWDDENAATETEKIQPLPNVKKPSQRSNNRQTVQWPFLYDSHEDTESDTSSSSFRPLTSSLPRRATWQGSKRNSVGTLLDNIVPDYIVNYLRGETPETVARRREKQQNPSPSEIAAHLRGRFGSEAFYDSASSNGQPRNSRSPGQLEDAAAGNGGGHHRGRRIRKWIVGWRGGIALNAGIGGLILLPTIVFFVVSLAKDRQGQSHLFEGSCEMVQRINFALHVAINLFVVILLMGANYAYQVMTSPTRVEVDMAHDRKKWLDIGVPSLRNLRFISKSRAMLALALIVAATTLPVMYNSVLLTKQYVPGHSILAVSESFSNGASFNSGSANNRAGLEDTEIRSLQQSAQRNELVNMTTETCIRTFDAPFQTSFNAVLLVIERTSSSSLLQTFESATPLSNHLRIKQDRHLYYDETIIEHCLAQSSKAESLCALDSNDAILGTVTLLVLTTIIAGASLLGFESFQPLATLGDALASYLQQPDPTTRSACLLTKVDIKQGRWASREARYYFPRAHHWFQTPSIPRWAFWSLSWMVPFGLAGAALGFSLQSASARLRSPVEARPTPADSTSTPTTWAFFMDSSVPDAGLCLLSALPHLLLSFLYLTTNALLSTYFLSHEFSSYAIPGTFLPIRVSGCNPRDAQTSSLYLSLPRPFSWLLLFLFVPVSVFLSASLRPVAIVFTSTAESSDLGSLYGFVTVPTAILVFFGLLLFVFGLVLALGLRRANPNSAAHMDGTSAGNPMVMRGGSCSAVISARCRRLPEDRDAGAYKVTWGVIRGATQTDPGTTGFSTGGVERVKVDDGYI